MSGRSTCHGQDDRLSGDMWLPNRPTAVDQALWTKDCFVALPRTHSPDHLLRWKPADLRQISGSSPGLSRT